MSTEDMSWYPEAPKEQREAEQQAESKTVASLPVIQDVLDWFEARIAQYKNPLLITGIDVSTPAEDVKNQVLLKQQLIIDYKQQRDDFKAEFSKYLEEQADAA